MKKLTMDRKADSPTPKKSWTNNKDQAQNLPLTHEKEIERAGWGRVSHYVNGVLTDRRCYRCGLWSPIENYYKDATRPTGYAHLCKTCDKEMRANRNRRTAKKSSTRAKVF